MKDLFTWDVDESRRLVLRNDRNWYCQDAGKPEKLWSVASQPEMHMAAEIERLQSRNDLLAQKVVELGHEVTDLWQVQDDLSKQIRDLRAEIDRMRPELIRLRLEVALMAFGGGAEYAVAQRSDCRPDERDMI